MGFSCIPCRDGGEFAARALHLDEDAMNQDEIPRVWEALRAIYGMDLTAATLVVLVKDGDTAVKFETIYFPQRETEK